GQAGRLEVWYATASDPESGTGCWVHHEVVAPTQGPAQVQGWAAVFGAGAAPVMERFGPDPLPASRALDAWPSAGAAIFDPPVIRGESGRLGWDLRWVEPEVGARALYTFPAWAWEREVLPAAQVVPVPSAPFTGSLRVDGVEIKLSPEARGNVAHIYGHGSAKRWAWLHAELGGGDVLEIVAAVSRRPGLEKLPPLAFVQLRLGGRDWPRDPVVAAALFRARLGLPTWQVHGTVGRWRLRAQVTIPDERAVSVGYVDPDGDSATCTNSERADAEIVLENRRSRWETARTWTLHGSAHAEVGSRP
ncbi:MAG: hypothetical protein ACYDB3_11330, partial [Acidimicrobiales bacterium]